MLRKFHIQIKKNTKNLDLYLASYRTIDTKLVVDLNVKSQTENFLKISRKCIGENLHNFRFGIDFLEQ